MKYKYKTNNFLSKKDIFDKLTNMKMLYNNKIFLYLKLILT